MRRVMLLAVIAVMVLGCVPALAQVGACSSQMLRGIWSMACTGFIDLSNLDPKVPKGTMVPMVALGRQTIDTEGKSTTKGFMSLAGTVSPVELESTLKVNPDCTGEGTYTITIKALGLSLPGKVTVVVMPHGQEFRAMLVNPGEGVSCELKKMFNTLLAQ